VKEIRFAGHEAVGEEGGEFSQKRKEEKKRNHMRLFERGHGRLAHVITWE